MANTIQDAMASAGLSPHKPFDLPANGKIVRYRGVGEKSGSKNCWAVLSAGGDGGFSGAFGSWKSGESHTWNSPSAKPLTFAQRLERKQNAQALREACIKEREAVQAAARAKAQRLWSRARPATNAHPYLERKQVNAYGLKQLRDMLLVPARDLNGTLHTLQFISSDGTKRFLTGGRIAGCYFAIGSPRDSLLIAEGYATAATLYQATGRAVAVCFSCGNMEAVALAMREKFPRLRLILCADNDLNTKGNPGLTSARQAARAVGGYVAVPKLDAAAQCPK